MARSERLADKYELIEPAGAGGMATVWRGRTHGEAGWARTVAIKRVLPALAESREFAAMFVEEARVVADLMHPNIVQVHDFCRDAHGHYFIVMEWVEGLDLGRWVRSFASEGQRVPWESVVSIGAEVLRGLAAAHERVDADGQPAPVFHRDVTPSNVLLGIHGTVKLGDFGLARAMDRITLTTPGVVKGKLAYVAPELVGGQRASARTDLYSLGVVLWECLAARRLFEARNDLELFVKVGQGKVPALSEIRDDLPPALADVVAHATSKYPDERYASAREMGRALGAVLREHAPPVDGDPLGDSVRERMALLRGRP